MDIFSFRLLIMVLGNFQCSSSNCGQVSSSVHSSHEINGVVTTTPDDSGTKNTGNCEKRESILSQNEGDLEQFSVSLTKMANDRVNSVKNGERENFKPETETASEDKHLKETILSPNKKLNFPRGINKTAVNSSCSHGDEFESNYNQLNLGGFVSNNGEEISRGKQDKGVDIVSTIDTNESEDNQNTRKDTGNIHKTGVNLNPQEKFVEQMDIDKERKLDEVLSFNCQGRCNMKFSAPCSCSTVCVLYNTCCENITLDCPDVVKRGREMFASYPNSAIMCRKDEVYQISWCLTGRHSEVNLMNRSRDISTPSTEGGVFGNDEKNRVDITMSDEANGDKYHEETPILDEQRNITLREATMIPVLTAAEIERWVMDSPVTDEVTGITYRNMSVWECYVGSEKGRKHLKWGLSLSYESQSPEGLQSLEVTSLLNPYKPLFNIAVFSQHLCDQQVIATCDGVLNSSEIRSSDIIRCNEFTALVFSKKTQKKYRNRFCAYCHEGRHDLLSLRTTVGSFIDSGSGLRVLVSLTASGSFFLQVEKSYVFKSFMTTWSTAVCPGINRSENLTSQQLLDNDSVEGLEESNNSPCKVICAEFPFTLHPDGRCKARHKALVAFGDDGLSALCDSVLFRIARFVSCGMQALLRSKAMLHADFLDPTVSFGTDVRTNKTLYIITLNMDIPDHVTEFFSKGKSGIVENVTTVAIALKAVREYRISDKILSTCDDVYPELVLHREMKSIIEAGRLDELILSKTESTNITEVMSTYRGPIKSVENTTVCVSRTELESDFNSPLLCMDDVEYQQDMEFVDHLLSTQCGIYFQNEKNIPNSLKNNASINRFLIDQRGAIQLMVLYLIRLLSLN